jgi:hypothetical protein
VRLEGKVNGSREFDKLTRPEMRKADDALRVLKRLAPDVAKTVDEVDAKLAEILARLQKIEDAEEALRMAPSRIVAPSREPNGEEVLASMRSMTPAAREALLLKLKQ